MLHMIVNTHNAESCAFRGNEEEQALTSAFDLFGEKAGERGITLHGSWVSRAAHEVFVLADAPNAHVIEELLLGVGLVGRSHTRVLPVVSTDDAMDVAEPAA